MQAIYPIEFERVIAALNETGVRYAIVGGVAVVLHGVDRLTADLDVVIDLEPAAAARVMTRLTVLGYRPRAPVNAEDFADPKKRKSWIETKNMQVFTLWDPANELPVLDLFAQYPLDFTRLIDNSIEVDLAGIPARLASVDDLIEMKQQSGRDRDLKDVEALREKNGRQS